ncbi:MAG: hypothetical protein K0S04_1242 [Herbinix sp.]|jgi:6-phosphofructokinase 1|nr:hypothetical protein [Herbinix sp.]
MNNLLIAQSGGPTVAINATLVGIIQAAQTNTKIDNIYGARNGIQGVFQENFIDLNEKIKNSDDAELLCQTPAAALGSCRFILEDYKNNNGNDVTEEMIQYLKPLIQGEVTKRYKNGIPIHMVL